jgi:uncharacterized protein YgbK (DUF1537 family)
MDTLRRTIIIDDDPTGCQTVRDVPLLLEWNTSLLDTVLQKDGAVFILTNTRAMDGRGARKVTEDVCRCIREVKDARGYDVTVISRSDSMLRGHLAEEVSTILGAFPEISGTVIVPAFFECGRITRNDTHYLVSGGQAIPASETEFAADPVFGYGTSHLPSWLEERSGGLFKASSCISLTAENASARMLSESPSGSFFIVNASSYRDLESICSQLRGAEKAGRRFLFRSAASLVKTYLGQRGEAFYRPSGKLSRVLVVAGSYTALTTSQLEELTKPGDISVVCLDTSSALSQDNYINQVGKMVENALRTGHCLLCTSREFAAGKDPADQLRLSGALASALCQIVSALPVPPDAVICKGGITSLTIARDALGIRRTRVLGQVCDGVPVWKNEENGHDFVVFPGNVGQKATLRKVFERYIY